MKKIIVSLVFIIFLITVSSGLNIGLDAWTTNATFYDNEDVKLNINVTNYELSLSPDNARVIVKTGDEVIKIPIREIPPDKSVVKTLNLGKFDAGTYRLEIYLEYDFLTVIDKTQTQYQHIQVIPSEPIRMKIYNIVVTSVRVPENLVIGKEFEIKFDVNSSTDSGFVEFGIVGKEFKTEGLREGVQTISEKYKIEKAGSYVFEIKAFIKKGDEIFMKDYRTENLIVADPSQYEHIEYKKIEQRKGNVAIESGKKPERNLIEEVGCFVVGGCNGDLTGPEISNIQMIEQRDRTIFTLVADDTQTGDSKIAHCSIKIDEGEWETMTAIDGAYDDAVEVVSFSAPILYEETGIQFKCEDEVGNIGVYTFVTEAKRKGTLHVKLVDPLLGKTVSGGNIYIEDKLKGMTNKDGVFETKLYCGRYKLTIKAKGYETRTRNIEIKADERTDVQLELSQALEMRFDIPKGYEKYVYGKKASYSEIHPQETKLMSYSFPLYSTNKEDVVKDLISIIDKFLVYDHNCWPERKPSCQAWHETDYKIIETGKGVCADWAVLGTSFSDSYGIPARYTRGCWQKVSLTGEKKKPCHAWQEVYLPEKGGWKHLDTLWNEFDNPCVYAKQMDIECVSDFISYNPEGQWEDRSEVYTCGKPCPDVKGIFDASESKAFEEGSGFEYTYLVLINNQKSATVTFSRKTDEYENTEIKRMYREGSLNETSIKNSLLSTIKPQFKHLGEIKDVKLIIENLDDKSLPVIVGISFMLDFSTDLTNFRHEFTISQYSRVNYTIETPLEVISISPAPNTKKDKQFNWFFDSAGMHTIDIQFMPEKIGFVIYDNPILNSVIWTVAKKLNATVYSKGNIDSLFSDDISKIYIVGGYTDINSDIERKIKERGIYTQRLIDDEIDTSAELALMFWDKSDAVIANVYDYDSVKLAEEYAMKEEMPLLLINNDAVAENVENAIGQLKAGIIYISDPNDRFTQDVKSDLNNLGKTSYLETQEKEDKLLKEVYSESITHKDQTPLILGIITIITLLVIIIVAFLILKKRG